MKKKLKYLAESILTGIGLALTLIESYDTIQHTKINITFLYALIIGAILGLIWFIINGYIVEGFLRNKISITSNAIDIKIDIFFGDIFKQKGYKAIGVNEFFDSAVDDEHISMDSLHGQMIKRYWNKNVSDWDKQILNGLKDVSFEELNRKSPGKNSKYKIGTTVKTINGENKFLCVALSRTNVDNFQASATSDELRIALTGLLKKARQLCSGDILNIPLLGSGLSRTSIKSNIIVDLILLSIFEESKIEKITNNIRIVLPKEKKNKIDLMNILEDWR